MAPAPPHIPHIPHVGALPAGALNAITDVPGVRVGHATVDDPARGVHTGVTVVRPHAHDPYTQRVPAGVAVLNGFGKSVGLMQVQELGVLESPIALTNTFAVPAVSAAITAQTVAAHPECGRDWPTVNPLVFECNDGWLNDIQQPAVTAAHYTAAWHAAAAGDVAQGAVGAGRGMSCYGLKGGIGSASRGAASHTVGALVLANQGRPEQLTIAGLPVGARLGQARAANSDQHDNGPERGSIILLLATDAPLDARQLRRLALRAGAGLACTGSVFGHGSGDIALAFSTAYTLPLLPTAPMPAIALLHDARLDPLFQAAADATEQAIVHALWHAGTLAGRDGRVRQGLAARIAHWPADTFTRDRLPPPSPSPAPPLP